MRGGEGREDEAVEEARRRHAHTYASAQVERGEHLDR